MTHVMSARSARRLVAALVALGAVLAAVALSAPADSTPTGGGPAAAGDYWSRLVAASRDLGPARERTISLTVNLRSASRPSALVRWARDNGLRVRWHSGAGWAVVHGRPGAFAAAFARPVHDFVTPGGRRFYGARVQPAVPQALRGEVASIGRLGTAPMTHKTSLVPPGGLSPKGAVQVYDATPLADAGYDGAGQTVVFFEWAPSPQSDLDGFVEATGLPPMDLQQPTSFADDVPDAAGETTLDIESVHAIAPKAKMVVVDANVATDTSGIAELFSSVDQQYPGAIWSLSIDWFCDKQLSWSDVQAIDQALATAESHGTSAFAASGDTGGLECKAFLRDPFQPPGPNDVGVLAIGSLPSMTAVGGTTLSVSEKGEWFNEAVWGQTALSQGTGGGASSSFPRPDFQKRISAGLPPDVQQFRVVPDIAADADPLTGLHIFSDGEDSQGGGTSMAAPIWAGLTALMNQYLESNGGHKIGSFNQVIYDIAQGQPKLVPLHDIVLGGNAVWSAAPGFDLVTGWGTPITWNLVRDILDYQKDKG